MQIRHLMLLGLYLSVIVGGCSSENNSTLQKAREYCLAQNGVIIQSMEGTELCRYQEEVQYDDGISPFTHNCEIIAFYEGRCDEGFVQEIVPTTQTLCDGSTLRTSLCNRVEDILLHLDNTGYAHDRNNNFSLVPDVDKFPFPDGVTDPYNLFLDCSGYVGYYVLQGIVPSLYTKLQEESKYSCGRPLAADFADVFMNASDNFIEATEDDKTNDNVCWGQVKHVENAKPGDIIVYKHSENFGSETEPCSDGRTITLAKCMKCEYKGTDCASAGKSADCTDLGKTVDGCTVVCTARKNTGHVLYVHGTPHRSTHCKDSAPFSSLGNNGCYSDKLVAQGAPGSFQWVVPVNDSTTAPHSGDSRHSGEDKSVYKENLYHAWAKKYNNQIDLYRCSDGSYHRDCTLNGGNENAKKIEINTVKESSPTGIGSGYFYVNDAREGFRTKYGADITQAEIFIGRPAKCD